MFQIHLHLNDARQAIRRGLREIEHHAEALCEEFKAYRKAIVERNRARLQEGQGGYFALVLYFTPSVEGQGGERGWTLRWNRADRVPGANGKRVTRYHAVRLRGSGKVHLQTLLASAGDTGHDDVIADFEERARRLRALQKRYRSILEALDHQPSELVEIYRAENDRFSASTAA
jgi:hypothetical protein